MVFKCINIRQVPREVFKTAASGLCFQHFPRDLANVDAWKTMFDPYILTPAQCAFNDCNGLLIFVVEGHDIGKGTVL